MKIVKTLESSWVQKKNQLKRILKHLFPDNTPKLAAKEDRQLGFLKALENYDTIKGFFDDKGISYQIDSKGIFIHMNIDFYPICQRIEMQHLESLLAKKDTTPLSVEVRQVMYAGQPIAAYDYVLGKKTTSELLLDYFQKESCLPYASVIEWVDKHPEILEPPLMILTAVLSLSLDLKEKAYYYALHANYLITSAINKCASDPIRIPTYTQAQIERQLLEENIRPYFTSTDVTKEDWNTWWITSPLEHMEEAVGKISKVYRTSDTPYWLAKQTTLSVFNIKNGTTFSLYKREGDCIQADIDNLSALEKEQLDKTLAKYKSEDQPTIPKNPQLDLAR